MDLPPKVEVRNHSAIRIVPVTCCTGLGDAHEQTTRGTETGGDRELAGCQFKGRLFGKAFRKLLEQLSDGTGASIQWPPGLG